MFIQATQFTRMSLIWRVLCLIIVVEGSVVHKEEAMTDFIFHQSNPPCRDLNTTKELRPCTVTNQED